MKKTLLIGATAALAAFVQPVGAQSFDTSPANHGNWLICVRLLTTAGPCTDFGPVQDAGQAGGWAQVDWITGLGGPSYGTAGNGENARWEYTFRTTLHASETGPGNIWVPAFYLDNYFVNFAFNGSPVAPGDVNWYSGGPYAGVPLPATDVNWMSQFGFDILRLPFVEGPNTFDVVISGNGQTDAMALSGTYTVPEPTTVGLVAFGLAGVGLVARRRSRSA
jgi:hypothetical protein